MVKVGLIAFANNSGLGAQTRRLAKMLNPDRIMVIDSSGFSPNKEQHFDWYDGYKYFIVNGFPTDEQVQKFLPNLTHVFVVENPYNFSLVWYGQKQGTKILCQSNYEFCDNLDKAYLPVPDTFLMPSHWKIEDMKERFGEDRVAYLPPPMDPEEFRSPRSVNLKRKSTPRFLHVIGTQAMLDRNGTLDLLEAVKLSKMDFELVIKTQHPLSMNVFLDDPRVKYIINDEKDNSSLYEDFDALLLPRRWGGLCLTMNEALMSALPVIMSDITPNKEILPKEWLVNAPFKGTFPARTPIEYYSVDHKAFANKIDWLCKQDFDALKKEAFHIGVKNFGMGSLRQKYLDLFNDGKS